MCLFQYSFKLSGALDNIISLPIKKASKDHSKLIVIDSREIDLTRYAQLWIRPVPGTENLVINTISKIIIDQNLEYDSVDPTNEKEIAARKRNAERFEQIKGVIDGTVSVTDFIKRLDKKHKHHCKVKNLQK